MSQLWIDTFRSARTRADYAFLFTGAVADGFPVQSDEAEHPTRLVPWHNAVRAVADPNDEALLVWRYDLAHGFAFESPEVEKRFRDLLRGEEPAAPTDTVAQARAQMGRPVERPLPLDPPSALHVMWQVLTRVTQGNLGACIVILPDIDAACASAGGSSQGVEATALALMRLCEQDSFAHAGHLILMSVGSMGSLPERLRRTGGPIRVVEVMPPTQEERERFLNHVCLPSDLQERAGELRESIAAEARRVASDARTQQMAKERWLNENPSDQDKLFADSTHSELLVQIQQDQVHLASLVAAQTKVFGRLRRNLERELKKVTEQLNDPNGSCAIRPLTDELWKTAGEGDVVLVPVGSSGAQEMTILRSPKGKSHDAWLSFRGNPTKRAHVHGDPASPLLFTVKGGKLLVRPSSIDPYTILYENFQDVLEFLPSARRAAQQHKDELETPLVKLQQRDPANMLHARAQLAGHQASLDERRQSCVQQWEREREEARSSIQQLIALQKNPVCEQLTDLMAQLERLQASAGDDTSGRFDHPPMGVEALARLTGSLGYRQLRALLTDAQHRGEPLSYESVREVRVRMLNESFGHLLQIVDPPYGFEGIADLEGPKAYFAMVATRMREGDLKRVPQGCTLVGPPGTGKSALATALAREAGLLLVTPLTTQERWVGASERNVHDLHAALLMLAPVIVFRDEIDQEDSGRDGFSGDSGVGNRTRQAWMTFLADPAIRGRVFVVNATNRPDLVDAALSRAGRSDDLLAILMPSAKAREALFPLMIQREGFASNVTDFASLAQQTVGLSGADIQVIVQRADRHSARGVITHEDLVWAVTDYIPQNDQLEIARMTLYAVGAARSRALLPENVEEEVARARAILDSYGETLPSTRRHGSPGRKSVDEEN